MQTQNSLLRIDLVSVYEQSLTCESQTIRTKSISTICLIIGISLYRCRTALT